MSFLRKFGLVLSGSFLKLILFLLATTIAINYTFGTPNILKNSLEESGLYGEIVDSTIDTSIEQNEKNYQDLPLDQPEIRKAANEAFNPELLRDSTNNFVDGIYGWLNGKTAVPEFRIDFRAAKQSFVEKVADYAMERVRSLRPCTRQENILLSSETFNPFEAKCRPPIVISAQRQQLIEELNSSDILKDPVLTEENLPADTRNQFKNQLKPLPTVFQLSEKLPLILGLLAIILAALLIFLDRDRLRGIKKVGTILLGAGLFLIVVSLIFQYLFTSMNRPESSFGNFLGSEDASLKTTVLRAFSMVYGEFNKTLIIIAGIYGVLGGIVILVSRLVHKNNNTKTQDQSDDNSPDIKLPEPLKSTPPHQSENLPEQKDNSPKI